jgi:hypothetical protein
MLRLRPVIILAFWLATVGLLGYEVVQKSPETPLGPLPGATLASWADRSVAWRAVTGITPVDRLLHESQEACLYYRGLAGGRLR